MAEKKGSTIYLWLPSFYDFQFFTFSIFFKNLKICI